MRKFVFILLLILFFVPIAAAQEPDYKVYLPMILSLFNSDNNWRLIVPQGSTNYVLNPSAEASTNFAALAGTTVTRVTTYQKYGLYSYRVETNADNEGITLTLLALTNANHYVTMRVRGTLPASWDWSLDNTIYTVPRLIEKIDANWNLYGLHIQASQANGSTTLYIRQNGAGSGDFYLDGIQVEPLDIWTTYIDGTQEDCTWVGTTHASISKRSSESRAGGISQDFFTEYNFQIKKVVGTSAIARQVGVDNYAILPGGELNNIKIQPREFTIIGKFIANTEQELHQKRQALQLALLETSYPNSQPFRVRFNGAQVQKELAGHYTGGLEGDLAAFYGNIEIVEDDRYMERALYTENAAIQIISPFPFWQEVGESAVVLDTNDSATFRIVAGRLESTSQWTELGPPAAGGTYSFLYAIAEDLEYIYLGGNFLNFDNIANADYIVRYHKGTGAYSALGTGMNNSVWDLAIGPSGLLYAVGEFTTAGGGAANRIAVWDPATSTWSALGSGLNGFGDCLTIGQNGLVYVGGTFTTANGVAAAGIAAWNGTTFVALGTGIAGGSPTTLAIHPRSGNLYAGGLFTSAGGVTANNIAIWNTTTLAWSALSSEPSAEVDGLAFRSDGLLYATGQFTTAGGTTVNYVAAWNGASWANLSSGFDAPGFSIAVGPDGAVYVTGQFTTAGGVSLSDRFARWNGGGWGHLDINLPGSNQTYSVLVSKYNIDPVIKQKYDLYLGFADTGTGNFAGKVTVGNEGSSPAFPKIVFSRSGGTTATIKTLKNERTGKELLLNYGLLDGETLIIDLTPTQRSVNTTFLGSHFEAVLPNSDFGTWALMPGDNDITSFVATSGSPTVTAYMLWRDVFEGYD